MIDKLNIFNIQRFSVHDGSGIRTTVFFKGCPLHCTWCANPESQKSKKELMYISNKCVKCGLCAETCPNNAISFINESPHFIRENCRQCGLCAKACLHDAIQICGNIYTVDEVMEIIRCDKDYYDISNGGVTVSGGEPLCQSEGVKDLLTKLKSENYHTAVETAGNVPKDAFSAVLPVSDLFLFDLKHCNSEKLKHATGANLELILDNLAFVAESGKEIIVRVPVIPDYNDDADTIKGIFSLVAKRKINRVDLLPYHVLGKNKYSQLGLTYSINAESTEKSSLHKFLAYGEACGINVTIAGKVISN